MTYYVDHVGTEEDFPGVPFPSPGVRVGFDVERSSAKRGSLVGDEGLVVYDNPVDMMRWPCRLWQVSDLEGAVRPTPWANWQRCQAYTVDQELAGHLVLGPNGHEVAAIIQRAKLLTSGEVAALAALPAAGEQLATQAVWVRWLAQGRGGCPVGVGLLRLDDAVNEAARRASPGLLGEGEGHGLGLPADLAWQKAKSAAAAAALACGAPQLADAEARQRLAHRWTAVISRSSQAK